MSPESINVAVAELCGWTKERDIYPNGTPCFRWVKGGQKGRWTSQKRKLDTQVPNYSGSLDCIAEAEKTLTPEERELYSAYLDIFCGEAYEAKAHWSARPAHASAEARAKAFLATKRPRTEP